MSDIDPFRIRALVPEYEALDAGFASASAATRAKHRSQLDIRYGAGPRQRLDLFFPADFIEPAPIHLFLHGGYWRANTKESFAFPADTIVAEGAIAAIVEYTLMPGARMAQLVNEARSAATWLATHAAEFGGDAGRISASGHSAGAHLASYLAAKAPHEHAFPATPVRSLLLLSGIYDLRPIATSFLQPELHLTPEEVADWSPLEAEQLAGPSVVLAVGHQETEPFHLQAQDLCFAAARRGVAIERLTIPDHDHMTIVRDLGVPGTRMAGLLAECIAASRGER